jgi:hypothetical protein
MAADRHDVVVGNVDRAVRCFLTKVQTRLQFYCLHRWIPYEQQHGNVV